MSATVNVNLFAQYFNAPVMQIPGRLHPITVEYCPPTNAGHVAVRAGTHRRHPQLDPTPYLQLMQRIDQQYSSAERGDVLVFLSGMDDIARLCDAARGYAQLHGGWVVLPLHSSLAAEEQDRVFDRPPDGVRKIIISTNIAETSVTIDGIRFVIDSGLEKEMRYDPASGVRRLMVAFISKASAEQRKGRAGRTGPGVCFRLFSEQDFEEHFEPFSKPEVQRMNLDSTLLQIIAQGQDPRDFPFIDPPAPEALVAALASLEELGAIVELTEGESPEEPSASQLTCTALGDALSMLPVDLAAGKILLLSTVFHDAAPAIRSLTTVAAALSVQSPIQRRREGLNANAGRGDDTNQAADKQRHQNSFDSQHGDPFTLLNCFDDWICVKKGKGGVKAPRSNTKGSETHGWCKRHGLQESRLYEIAKLQQQFQQMLRDSGLSKADDAKPGDTNRRRDEALRRRQLRELQLTVDRQRGQRVLRVDDGGGVDEEDETEIVESGSSGSLMLDVRHLDFEISYKLDAPSQIGRNLSARDCNLMKLIIAASFYPNFAIADEHNAGKKASDACFHTRFKQFVKLHPSSGLSADPVGACGPGELYHRIIVRRLDCHCVRARRSAFICFCP
jgi:HrpA-like RNA helicase